MLGGRQGRPPKSYLLLKEGPQRRTSLRSDDLEVLRFQAPPTEALEMWDRMSFKFLINEPEDGNLATTPSAVAKFCPYFKAAEAAAIPGFGRPAKRAAQPGSLLRSEEINWITSSCGAGVDGI